MPRVSASESRRRHGSVPKTRRPSGEPRAIRRRTSAKPPASTEAEGRVANPFGDAATSSAARTRYGSPSLGIASPRAPNSPRRLSGDGSPGSPGPFASHGAGHAVFGAGGSSPPAWEPCSSPAFGRPEVRSVAHPPPNPFGRSSPPMADNPFGAPMRASAAPSTSRGPAFATPALPTPRSPFQASVGAGDQPLGGVSSFGRSSPPTADNPLGAPTRARPPISLTRASRSSFGAAPESTFRGRS